VENKISVNALNELLMAKEAVFLLDVREPHEHEVFNLGGSLIPLADLPYRLKALPRDQLIVVYCRSGQRSQTAVDFLQQMGFMQAKNLVGGVLAWSDLIKNCP
jgi:rhodanese-related sulfurtransferase